MKFVSVSAALLFALPALADGKPTSKYEVELVKDLAYVEGKDEAPERHKLDLYLPKGQKDFATLLFVHGGGWKSGNKELFAFLGKSFAEQGIAVASINYRLAPIKFPAPAEDTAAAFTWLHDHIAQHGGSADKLFVGGHSAGGHLVSILATDESYLKAHKLGLSDIKGVISISGLYTIRRGRFPNFDDTEEAAAKGSPIKQIHGKHPPFLILYADGDFPGFGDMAEDFAKALRSAGNEPICRKIDKRTHGTIALDTANDGDPAREAILNFIKREATNNTKDTK